MNEEDLELIADFANDIGIRLYKGPLGEWYRSNNDAVWDPYFNTMDAFSLMSIGHMELQFLTGKKEVHITSTCGRLSYSLPFGDSIEHTTQCLILKLAVELQKRKRDGK